MDKKGISAIVATVLIILITVAGVSIIWVGIVPMIRESFDFQDLDGRVSVLSSGGYTVYDPVREVATVQVKREVDEGVMGRIKVSFSIDGNSVSSTVVAPNSGQTKVYAFDLSGYGVPDSVAASPIFVGKNGAEKEGSVTSTANLPAKSISEVRGSVYDLGGDYFYEVPMDGLVSIWTFSGDAKDGVGENDGTVYGEGDELVDGVLSLDGVDDYVNVADSLSNSLRNEITISGWFYYDVFNSSGLVWKSSYNYIFYAEGNAIRLTVYNGTVSSTTSFSKNLLVVPGWNYISGVFNGTNSILYLNGVQTGTVGESISGTIKDAAGDLVIGKRGDGVATYFDGKIDNIMIYDRGLLGEEIMEIYGAQKKS